MPLAEDSRDLVGPILQTGATARAVVNAIKRSNQDVRVVDRASYLRVMAAPPCVVTREAIEAELGSSFRLPGDLEAIMLSFKGRLSISEAAASWTLLPGTNGRRY